MDSLPVTHAMNARNSALRAGSPRSATVLSRHASHLHRWERAFVNPFLRIARPHKGHFLALEDLFLLIDQANPKSQAPRRINARLANHTPTHKTPVSLTADLRHTFLYLTRISGRDAEHTDSDTKDSSPTKVEPRDEQPDPQNAKRPPSKRKTGTSLSAINHCAGGIGVVGAT